MVKSVGVLPREVEIKEVRVQVPLACVSSSKVISPLVVVTKLVKKSNTIMNPLWKNHMK